MASPQPQHVTMTPPPPPAGQAAQASVTMTAPAPTAVAEAAATKDSTAPTPEAAANFSATLPGHSPLNAAMDDRVRYTAYVRLPFARGDFVDPPLVDWPVQRDQQLWNILSQAPRGQPPDWRQLAAHFDVPLAFLLQQAAWLYEQQLVQVRAQMRQVVLPRSGSGAALSQAAASGVEKKSDVTTTASRPAIGVRHPSTSTVTQSRHGGARSSGVSRRGSATRRESETRNYVAAQSQLRRAVAAAAERSGNQDDEVVVDNLAPGSSSSESNDNDHDDKDTDAKRLPLRSRIFGRDVQRRNAPTSKARQAEQVYGDEESGEQGDDDDDDDDDDATDDAPAFLPIAGPSRSARGSTGRDEENLRATLRNPGQGKQATTGDDRKQMASIAKTTTTPSIGSSFSDLDEASVTQSAMEEYIMSRMQRAPSATTAAAARRSAGATTSSSSPMATIVTSSSTDDSSGFSRAFRSPR